MPDQNDKPDYDALIPELRLWNAGKGGDIDVWLAGIGSYEHAVAYLRLFWPAFTVHEDCVLFADFNPESFRGFMEQTAGDKRRVEVVMNHHHILDLFPNVPQEPSKALIIHLGRSLKEIWSCKLKHDFPTRVIAVSFPEDETEDPRDYEITFFQDKR